MTDLSSAVTRVPGVSSPSIRISSNNMANIAGAVFTVPIAQTTATNLILSGWSKGQYVTGAPDLNYGIVCDLQFNDMTTQTGLGVSFDAGNHDWQYRTLTITVSKPVKSATYVLENV